MPGWLDFEELMDEQIARCLMALETATADNLLTLQCFTKSLRSVKEAVASAVQAPTYAQARNQFKAAAAGVPLQF